MPKTFNTFKVGLGTSQTEICKRNWQMTDRVRFGHLVHLVNEMQVHEQRFKIVEILYASAFS